VCAPALLQGRKRLKVPVETLLKYDS